MPYPKPDDEDFDETREYATSLGFFVMKFAETERSINYALVTLSGADWAMSRVLFSGVKVDQGKTMINRLFEVRGISDNSPQRLRLKEAFAQLTLITNVRNDLLHYGLSHDDELGPIATNRFGIYPPDRARVSPISRDILARMTADLGQINLIIGNLIARLAGIPLFPEMEQGANQPWRYTPPPPPPPPKQTRSRSAAPKPPRQS